MNIEKLINELSDDTGIYFHEFTQDNDNIIAKSHFFKITFGPTYVEIINDHILPGPILEKLMKEKLPFRIDYIVDNYYDILTAYLDELQSMCLGADYHDEEGY